MIYLKTNSRWTKNRNKDRLLYYHVNVLLSGTAEMEIEMTPISAFHGLLINMPPHPFTVCEE